MDLSLFLKKNKIKKENVLFPAVSALRDGEGNVLPWELRALTTEDVENLRMSYTKQVPVNEEKGIYRTVTCPEWAAAFCAAAVVQPDLYSAELQDSYGVKTPAALLVQMVDNPGEFKALLNCVRRISGLDETEDDRIRSAKN